MEVAGIAAGTAMANAVVQLRKEKQSYQEKLENARGEDVFKYLLLINTSAIELYVTQTRVQADQSFRLSRFMSILGFGVLVAAVVVAVVANSQDKSLDAAYITVIAGALVQFISGVFFYLYSQTLRQINVFYRQMTEQQQLSMSVLAGKLELDVTPPAPKSDS
jgi:hypothetical protein